MKGMLYGIGAGPGDPGLLTLKAVDALRRCGVIAVPKTGNGEGAAFSIVEQYVGGKELLECHFSMDRDIEKRKESRRQCAERIARRLEDGMDVGYVTLGDPTTYSTYMYVHEIITGMGFEAAIIPGITSYAAAAAAFGDALCEGGDTLTIIPARHGEDIDDLLDYPGNKVIMKSGNNLANVIDRLKARGYAARTKIAYRVTMDGQRLFADLGEFESAPETGYFTLALVREKG